MKQFHQTTIFKLYHFLMRRMDVKTLTLFVGCGFIMIYLCYAIFGMTEHDAGMMYLGIACAMVPHAFFGGAVHIWYGIALTRYWKKSEYGKIIFDPKAVMKGSRNRFEILELTQARIGDEVKPYSLMDMGFIAFSAWTCIYMARAYHIEGVTTVMWLAALSNLISMWASNLAFRK